jgi:hypothetical protein
MSSTRWAIAALLLTSLASSASAQTVFFDNFQYANPNGPLPFTTSYAHIPNTVPNGLAPLGSFMIASNIAADLGGGVAAHEIIPVAGGGNPDFFDHTFGNANGLYMAVNASGASNIYGRSGIAVVPNQEYRFSVWLNSWTNLDGVFGQLDVQITGDNTGLLAANPTLNAPAVGDYPAWGQNWTEASFVFNVGNNNFISFEIFNVLTNALGNDYQLDDISIVAIPEPSVIALSGLGFTALGAAVYNRIQARKRRKLRAKQQAETQAQVA